MRSAMKLLALTFAMFVVVVATAHGTERWLRHTDDPPAGDIAIYEGAPFVHEVTYYHCRGRPSTYTEPVFLAANLGLFGAIALVSATLWFRSSPSGLMHWTTFAASRIGSAMAATSLLVGLGMLLQRLRWLGP